MFLFCEVGRKVGNSMGGRGERQIIKSGAQAGTEMRVCFIEISWWDADGEAADVIYGCSIMGALFSSHKDGQPSPVWGGGPELNCSERRAGESSRSAARTAHFQVH